MAPYYNKPDQRMLEAHYRAVADEGDLPDRRLQRARPHRAPTSTRATLLRLAEHPRIVAVKEASANLEQIMTILRDRPAGFSVLSGDDSWTYPLLALGGDGVISVASNEVPDVMVAAVRGGPDRRLGDGSRDSTSATSSCSGSTSSRPNPVPVKAALAAMGLIEDVLRRPLLPLDEPAARCRAASAVLAELGHRRVAGATARTGTSSVAA